VTYGCEAWTLTNRDEQHLRIFERRILRKIFGPVQNEDGSWRNRMNYELNELIENADIVRFIKKKSRRIAWLGHVMRVDDKRTPKRLLELKPIGTRTRGRPRKRWIADIEEDMEIMGVRRWRKQCEERAEWKSITENPQWVVTPVKEEEGMYILTLRRLMSYIYGAPILDVSRSHTTTHHSR